MTQTSRLDPRLALHAALDGELDAAGMVEFETLLSQDATLAAEYERLMTLRAALREKLPRATAADGLRLRVAAIAPAKTPTAPATRAAPSSWRALAASIIVSAGLASGATYLVLSQTQPPIANMVVAAHMRGLIAASPVDVVSSDRHTVKPWFDAHMALSPPVVDLAAQGFVLIGGRADIVADAPAPTLVYRHNEHVISVSALPVSRARSAGGHAAIGGYRIETWSDGDFTYWATSDIEQPELDAFVTAFKAAARN